MGIAILLFFVCLRPAIYFFRVKKVRAVRQEKTEYPIKERLNLATPLTPAHRTRLALFATVFPRMRYNFVMAALGCQWLLLVKVTWPITQADRHCLDILNSGEFRMDQYIHLLKQMSDYKELRVTEEDYKKLDFLLK